MAATDATVAMAEYISGSEDKFVDLMNKKVKELGLKNTHFSNSTGLDQDNHYSSSYDMAMIARELVINHPDILKFSSIYEDYLRQNTDRKFWLVNTNKLISQYQGTDGLKTGHTDDAGYCLAATTKRNDMRLIAIVLGEDNSKVRNKETMELLDYGFQNTKLKKLKNKGSIIKSINVKNSDVKNFNLILKDNLVVVEDLGDDNSYKYKTIINNIDLPLKKNQVVGRIEVYLNNKKISTGDIVSDRNVNSLKLIDLFKESISQIIYGSY